MRVELELLRNDKLAVRFDYDARLVGEIKKLQHRKWNPKEKRWEVHLAHLPEVIKSFGLSREQVARPIITAWRAKWGEKRLRIRLNALEGKIEGVNAPWVEIDDATSFFLPGHTYSPKFKSKQWDGKRHLYNRRTQSFPAGLWPRIRAILDAQKTEYALEEEAPPPPTGRIECAPARSELRPYQQEALRGALDARRGILQLATGGGKTLLAAHLIREFGLPAFFFVHTRELLHQTVRVFSEELGIETGVLGDGIAEIREVTVATLQTAARVFDLAVPRRGGEEDEEGERERPTRLGERKAEIAEAIENAGVVFFDECHHVPAETAYKIAFHTPRAQVRLGLSATPWRDDHHDLLLEAALGPKICTVTCTDLIEQEHLVRPRISMELISPPRIPRRGLAYADVYRAAIVESQSRNRAIAARAREWAAERKSVLILVVQIEHGRRLLELLPEARFSHGTLAMDERRQILKDLEQKLPPILIATTLADEGLDIPSLDAVILAGGGKSATKAYQRIGRALRPWPGKSEALVLDFFDPVQYLDEHSLARLALYRAEPGFEVTAKGFRA